MIYSIKMNFLSALKHANDLLALTTVGEAKYGWHQKSIGSQVKLKNGDNAWIRLIFQKINSETCHLWDGELEASKFNIPAKPNLLKSVDWIDENYQWRATLSDFIDSKSLSKEPFPEQSLVLSTQWILNLKINLNILSKISTDRISVRQDLINPRIRERFGNQIDTNINAWITMHGDLHFANLTNEGPYILDWEGWGIGPRGLDCAFLSIYSIAYSDLHDQIQLHFSEELNSHDGIISQLFVCSELMRMTEVHNDHPHLYSLIKNKASALLNH